ncbi:P-loop containing nucleoside triphosphate hydrolase protein, partial [Mycena olivaceomarginata]
LPATPKIFNGRESELQALVDSLLKDPAWVAILGPGGMGKTTLVVAAIHNPKVVDKYPIQHFVQCNSAWTNDSLVATIASHLGLEVSRGLAKEVIHNHSMAQMAHRKLSIGPPCLVILDNFETPWEAVDGWAKVEEFLSLLTDLVHVALLITIRGAKRPGKVQWTHPFLCPLAPLAPIAARQTFIEIADDIHYNLELDQLLEIADNIPLAVQLVAAIAASEGCQATLEHWKHEKTALGNDKHSNLEISITLSLSSPHILSSPDAVELLSLMALLSDGISDIDLAQSKPPIPEIWKCKATLIRTSLAYIDHTGRLKVLAPIREYIQATKPPSPDLVRPLRRHLNDLVKLWTTWLQGSPLPADLIPQLFSNLGNLQNLLLYGLDCDPAELGETIQGIICLNRLNVSINHGLTLLMLCVPDILAKMDDHKIHGRYITEAIQTFELNSILDPEKSIEQGIEHFRIIRDIEGEGKYWCLGEAHD